MASMTVRKLDETTKRLIKQKAAKHNRSMEAEAREILRKGAREPEPQTGEEFVAEIRRVVESTGGLDGLIANIPKRSRARRIDTSRW